MRALGCWRELRIVRGHFHMKFAGLIYRRCGLFVATAHRLRILGSSRQCLPKHCLALCFLVNLTLSEADGGGPLLGFRRIIRPVILQQVVYLQEMHPGARHRASFNVHYCSHIVQVDFPKWRWLFASNLESEATSK